MRGAGNRHSLYSSATNDLGEPGSELYRGGRQLEQVADGEETKRPAVHHERSRGMHRVDNGHGPERLDDATRHRPDGSYQKMSFRPAAGRLSSVANRVPCGKSNDSVAQ